MTLGTNLNTSSADFEDNHKHYQTLRERHAGIFKQTVNPKEDHSIKRHKDRGKLLARERVNELLDPGAPF